MDTKQRVTYLVKELSYHWSPHNSTTLIDIPKTITYNCLKIKYV